MFSRALCSATFRYTYGAQRTCGRTCGFELRRRNGWETEAVCRAREARRTAKQAAIAAARASSPLVPRPCVICSTSFVGPRGNYCSADCTRVAKREYDRSYNATRQRKRTGCTRCAGPLPSAKRNRCDACLELGRRERKRRERRRVRNLQTGVRSEPYTLTEIADRDRRRCQLCGKRVAMTKSVPHPKAPTIDHVVPRACGGDDTKANVQLAHFLCNSIKSARGTQQLALIG